jgi:twitching motility protein PilI
MADDAKVDLRTSREGSAVQGASETTAPAASMRLGFAAAGTRWLVALADAVEVIALPSVAAVPLTQPWFRGIANLRGSLFGVVDFAGFLARGAAAPTPTDAQARLVVFGPRTGDVRAALLVERALGLADVAELARAAPPAGAPSWFRDRWFAADGDAWQEIDLAALARNPVFLKVGR